jgi:sulfite reductase (NADPH) hemoprotein beta-component
MAGVQRAGKVVSANRLDTGAVVWLGDGGTWVDRVATAAVLNDADAEAALARAKDLPCVVVDPALVEVTVTDGRPQPLRPRERIRSRGPSVRPDLGVQADPRP